MYKLKFLIFCFLIIIAPFHLLGQNDLFLLKLTFQYNKTQVNTKIAAPTKWMVLSYISSEKNQQIILLKSTRKKNQLHNNLLILGGLAPLIVLHDVSWTQSICSNKLSKVSHKYISLTSQVIIPKNNKSCLN